MINLYYKFYTSFDSDKILLATNQMIEDKNKFGSNYIRLKTYLKDFSWDINNIILNKVILEDLKTPVKKLNFDLAETSYLSFNHPVITNNFGSSVLYENNILEVSTKLSRQNIENKTFAVISKFQDKFLISVNDNKIKSKYLNENEIINFIRHNNIKIVFLGLCVNKYHSINIFKNIKDINVFKVDTAYVKQTSFKNKDLPISENVKSYISDLNSNYQTMIKINSNLFYLEMN